MTKVILRETIKELGQKGEIKTVSDGFARNYLLPKGLVILASPSAMKKAEEWQKEEADRQEKEKTAYKEIAQLLRETTLTFQEKTKNEKGELYGSITTAAIAELLKEKRINVKKAWIQLKEPLKTTGKHTVNVVFPYNIPAELQILIEKEG